jgi:hypothetical protein
MDDFHSRHDSNAFIVIKNRYDVLFAVLHFFRGVSNCCFYVDRLQITSQ